jgi:hypothetical protein
MLFKTVGSLLVIGRTGILPVQVIDQDANTRPSKMLGLRKMCNKLANPVLLERFYPIRKIIIKG